MGTLLRFPAISLTRRDPHFQDPSQTIPNFVRQLKSFQKLTEDSLSGAVDRLETTMADINAIARLLPPGEFKTQFDLDRRALATQLDLAKSKIVDLWAQTDLDGHAPV
jgi:hypothetical protein